MAALGTQARRHPLDLIVDRPRSDAARAVAAAWLAFVVALLIGREVQDVASFAVAAASGALLVSLGFVAASRCRSLPQRASAERTRLGLLALLAGAALGIANLAANWSIAAAHPTFRSLLVERVTNLRPIDGLVVSPVVEEVMVRLFLMSVIAWLVSRFTRRRRLAFLLGLVGSAFVFALLHLDRPMPDSPALANGYRAALLTKYTLAGLPLGWIFWRWGVPYAILAHGAGNAAHLVVQRGIF